MILLHRFLQKHELDAVDAVELAGHDGDFAIAEFIIEGACRNVARIGIDAQGCTALLACGALVKLRESGAEAVAFGGWIDDEGVHDEHVVVVGCDLPRSVGVFVTLQMIENGGADDGVVLQLNVEIVAGERGFGGGAGWVDIAHPADGGAASFLFGMDVVVNGAHSVEIGRCGFAKGDGHCGVLLCWLRCEHFFEKLQANFRQPFEAVRMDRDALEAEACVKRESAAVAFVGVDAQRATAFFAGVAFVKIQHRAGVALAAKRGIDGEGVHDHDFVGARIDLPGRWRVIIALQFVEHCRANERAVGFLAAIRALNASLGIPDRFDGIRGEDLPRMAAWAAAEANPVYPAPVVYDQARFRRVLERLRA